MNKVKYTSGYKEDLTVGKIYDVIKVKDGFVRRRYLSKKSVLIENDNGEFFWYLLKGNLTGNPLFVDVTAEFRTSVIDDILNYE